MRIVPDLFADFLVYDSCYEPTHKKPGFVRQILQEFSDCSSALLRNLSEATWICEGKQDSGRRPSQAIGGSRSITDSSLQIISTAPKFSNTGAISALPASGKPAVGKVGGWTEILRRRFQNEVQAPFKIPDTIDSLDLCLPPTTSAAETGGQVPPKLSPRCTQFSVGTCMTKVGCGIETIRGKPSRKSSNSNLKSQLRSLWTPQLAGKSTAVAHLAESLGIKEPRFLRLLMGPCFSRVVEWTWSEGRTFSSL